MFNVSNKVCAIADVLILTILSFISLIDQSTIILVFVLCSIITVIMTSRLKIKTVIIYISILIVEICIINVIRSGFSVQTLYYALEISLLNTLTGFMIGIGLKIKKGLLNIIVFGASGLLTVFILRFIKLKFILNINIAETYINQNIKEVIKMLSQTLSDSNTDVAKTLIESLNNNIWYYGQALGMLIPAILIIISLLASFTVFLVSRKLLYFIYHTSFPDIKHFWELKMNRSGSVALVIMIILFFFSTSTMFSSAVMNVILILLSVYFICGLSVIDFHFRKTRLSSMTRALIYVIAAFAMLFITAVIPALNPILILLLVGLFDTTIDFRRSRKIGGR